MKTITGNTYPVKERIKALGGRWNKYAQGWDVPDSVAGEVQSLVESAGESTYIPRSNRSRVNYTRFASGAEYYQNSRGRCEDAPCCGCCS